MDRKKQFFNTIFTLFPRIDLSQEHTGKAATIRSPWHHQECSMPLLWRCGRNSLPLLWIDYGSMKKQRTKTLLCLCSSSLGRLIVEVVDHRTKASQDKDNKPSKKRVILEPSQETLWADLSLLHEESGENWSSQTMLDVESKILVSCQICLLGAFVVVAEISILTWF